MLARNDGNDLKMVVFLVLEALDAGCSSAGLESLYRDLRYIIAKLLQAKNHDQKISLIEPTLAKILPKFWQLKDLRIGIRHRHNIFRCVISYYYRI